MFKEREEEFTNYLSGKGLILQICQQVKKPQQQKLTNPAEKVCEGL